MSKESIKDEIEHFKKRGGDFSFAFGDVQLPVVYDERKDLFYVSRPGYEASVNADYNADMDDNLERLMNLLLSKYPQLTR